MITIDDFAKVKIQIGAVLEANKVPDADKLIQLIVDFGDVPVASAPVHPSDSLKDETLQQVQGDNGFEILPELAEKYPGKHVRQIMSAIAPFYPDPSILVGKQLTFCVNLEPRKFRGYISQGMLVATDNTEGVVPLVPEKPVEPGAQIH